MQIPLYKNEEWFSFANNMFTDHRCLETYFNNPLLMLIQFLELCNYWYIKQNKYGQYSDLRRFLKIRKLIFHKNGYLKY